MHISYIYNTEACYIEARCQCHWFLSPGDINYVFKIHFDVLLAISEMFPGLVVDYKRYTRVLFGKKNDFMMMQVSISEFQENLCINCFVKSKITKKSKGNSIRKVLHEMAKQKPKHIQRTEKTVILPTRHFPCRT